MERLGDAVARVLGRLEAQLREEKLGKVLSLPEKVRRGMASTPGGEVGCGNAAAHATLRQRAEPRDTGQHAGRRMKL